MDPIGPKLKLLRNTAGLTQSDVATKLGISVPAYSKIEIGVTDINLSRLEQIAIIFNSTLAELLKTDQDPLVSPKTSELENLKKRLSEKEGELESLQKRIIELYAELAKKS